MKKIYFNDKYGLTQAVLNGQKTMTRRVIKLTPSDKEYLETAFDYDLREMVILDRYSHYRNGEIVAIAQNYKDANVTLPDYDNATDGKGKGYAKGYSNKEFVRADLMPHHIRITNARIERLQDISDKDCLREGIMFGEFINTWDRYYFEVNGRNNITASTPKKAFATLINKVSGKGTWDSNPWVFVYEFELVN